MKKQKTDMFKGKREHTIRGQIMLYVVSLMVTALVVLGGLTIWLNYSSTNDTLENSMKEMAKVVSEGITYRLQSSENVVQEIGTMAVFSSQDTGLEDKKTMIAGKIQLYGCKRGGLIGTDGKDIFTGEDFSQAEFFQESIGGSVSVSEPMMNEQSGKMEIFVAAPLWKSGISQGTVSGLVYLVTPESYLEDVVNKVKISENGSAYIIDKEGTTIAHKDHQNVVNRENSTQDAKTDQSLNKIAEIEGKMMKGESGFGVYRYGGVSKFLAYAPIEGTDGWSVAVNAPVNDFMGSTLLGIVITLIAVAASIIIAVYVIRRVADGIGDPVKQCADRLNLLAEGDLQTEVPEISADNEIGILADATNVIVSGLKSVLEDVTYLLDSMGEGNFDIHTRAENFYRGDFQGMLLAIRRINSRLSEALRNINDAANQVTLGSGQLAESAQSLAEGATDQASSVEEILATVNSVTCQAEKNSEEAEGTSKKAKQMQSDAEHSMTQMELMTKAMRRINDKSSQIGNIIQDIEEIASQTNLLSLNASIEAARAGESGRGFAVVAGEIGHLATQSAEAVVDTRRLIEDTIKEVQEGNKIAEETFTILKKLIDGLRVIAAEVSSVGEESEQQAVMMKQLNEGVEQISAVIQSNSAAAEESSATSEELSAQAVTLNKLVAEFKLKQEK